MSDLSVSQSLPQSATTSLVGVENEKTHADLVTKNEQVAKAPVLEVIDKEIEETKESSHEEVEVALVEVNAFVQSMQRNLSFTIDEQLGQEIISVTDTETQEVIRQIPSEELVVLRKKMDDVVGILFDTKV